MCRTEGTRDEAHGRSSMSRHLSIRNISSNLCARFWLILPTDKQTVTGKNIYLLFVGGNNIVNTTSRDLELVDRHWKSIHEKWPGLLAESCLTADRSKTIMAQKREPLSCWTRSMFLVLYVTTRPIVARRVVNLVWHVLRVSWSSLVAAGLPVEALSDKRSVRSVLWEAININ